jgi:hypothetical protein
MPPVGVHGGALLVDAGLGIDRPHRGLDRRILLELCGYALDELIGRYIIYGCHVVSGFTAKPYRVPSVAGSPLAKPDVEDLGVVYKYCGQGLPRGLSSLSMDSEVAKSF